MNRRLILSLAAIAMIAALFATIAGCGGGKSGVIGSDQHGSIERGMTLDQVEAITGSPVRSHRTGSSKDPNIVWYFEKTEGEGLVRISFVGGKVESISPYDESVEAEG